MLSRYKRAPMVLEQLEDEVFHTHAKRWRPLAESLREDANADKGPRRYTPAALRKIKLPSYWSPWLWMK